MKRIAFLLCIIVNCQLSIVDYAHAQETFTERLQQPIAGKGTVVLRHDAQINALVNGTAHPTVVSTTRPVILSGRTDTISSLLTPDSLLAPTKKVRMNGFRVQVYAGGNSRDAKHRAQQMEALVHTHFPEQSVYTRFVSPRWICHVGDFQTREEALDLLMQMRKIPGFAEAITVRCKINAYVYE